MNCIGILYHRPVPYISSSAYDAIAQWNTDIAGPMRKLIDRYIGKYLFSFAEMLKSIVYRKISDSVGFAFLF